MAPLLEKLLLFGQNTRSARLRSLRHQDAPFAEHCIPGAMRQYRTLHPLVLALYIRDLRDQSRRHGKIVCEGLALLTSRLSAAIPGIGTIYADFIDLC